MSDIDDDLDDENFRAAPTIRVEGGVTIMTWFEADWPNGESAAARHRWKIVSLVDDDPSVS